MAYQSNSNIKKSTSQQTGKEEKVNKTEIGDNVSSPVDTLSLPSLKSKTISRTFGRADDYVELHIYNNSNQLIFSDNNFEDYTTPTNQETKAPLTNQIQIDPNKVLNDRGYFSGQYIVKLNILKNKIFNTDQLPFFIKEISSDRREIRSVTPKVTNAILDPAISEFIADIESSVYFKEFSINFGNDLILPSINVLLNKDTAKHELLIKTLKALPGNIVANSVFKVVEEITDPLLIRVDLGNLSLTGEGIPMAGPNFNIDIRLNNSIPSEFKTYSNILEYNLTSSYQHLLSKLEDDTIDLGIEYDYIRPVSESSEERSFHFENFIHFSNSTERLKNFKYKLELIEKYDKQISEIGNITGDTLNSNVVVLNKSSINEKKEKLIKGLDGYEQFLYFTSGTYAWPKQNTSNPFALYSITSSEAKSWLGYEFSHVSASGQLLSSSLYDKQNLYNLNKLLPSHITDNTDNSLYVGFVDMVGQHFDHIWSYIRAISKIHNADNLRGISKDLVYHKLKSIGLEVFDQFENSSLTEYILGESTSGSNFYGGSHFYTWKNHPLSSSLGVGLAVSSSETLITSSNVGSIPKGDITKEIWKRLYHNAPYLLKTKGTERGIKALMSCYGIPSSILNVKEYGGSTTTTGIFEDLDISDTYKTFTYEKQSLALKGNSGTGGYFIKTNWSSSLTDTYFTNKQQEEKAVEFRIKPIRASEKYHLFSLSGSQYNTTHYPDRDQHLLLDPYIGADISSSDDSTQYGRLQYYYGGTLTKQSQYFPVYDGDFWNIYIQAHDGSSDKINIDFGAYKANFNKNIHYFVTSSENLGDNNAYRYSWGTYHTGTGNRGAAIYAYFGGISPNLHSSYDNIDVLKYSGSLQEIRIHFGELLSHNTLRKHALEPFMYAGNTLSSSYSNVVRRLPLGSNDQQDSSSFHPNIDIPYLSENYDVTSSMSSQEWEEVVENHYLPTPDTIGSSTTSEKVRIDEGTVDNNILSPYVKGETSTLDRQPLDYEDLGIFFSPTDEINEDIIYTLGPFRMDDYIGNPLPSAQSSSYYEDLKNIKDLYFKKVKRRYNYWDYIKQIQYIDHTLFKMIEQFVPARANTKTGLVIEPNFLERTKFKRTLPVRSDAQTMEEGLHQTFDASLNRKVYKIRSSSTKDFGQEGLEGINNIEGQHDPGSYVISHNNLSFTTSSKGERMDQGTNATIFIYDDYVDPSQKDPNRENNQSCQDPIIPFDPQAGKPTGYKSHDSSVLLGNMIEGKKSKKYYTYKQYYMVSSSLY